MAKRGVIGSAHEHEDVELTTDKGEMLHVGNLLELGRDLAPRVLLDCHHDVRGRRKASRLGIELGAKARDHSVPNETIEAHIGLGPREMDTLGQLTHREPARARQLGQDGSIDSVHSRVIWPDRWLTASYVIR